MANNSWFQCKTHYQKMTDNGSEKRVSETYLVDALLWGEAEARIAKELQPFVKAGEELLMILLVSLLTAFWKKGRQSLMIDTIKLYKLSLLPMKIRGKKDVPIISIWFGLLIRSVCRKL